MSWSITFIGKPENVAKAVEDHAAKLDGQSKVEYESAAPHFAAICRENYGSDSLMIKINAGGHGYTSNGNRIQNQCTCTIELWYGTLGTLV